MLIVGLGASAGGLEALEEFFSEMPGDTGMAFVVVTHLHPGRVSLMPELLGRKAAMPVTEVDGTVVVEPNRVYLAPPGRLLEILNGTLHATEPPEPPEKAPRALAIDTFFRSLAADQKERAVGIVLSGTGTDGTLGLAEIKGASGMTMAQEESSAQYTGMPHSAIGSLRVDFVLPPRAMPRQLQAYAAKALRRDRGGGGALAKESEQSLARIFLILRSRTGHDFSHYKAATIRRRIERRMNVRQIDTVADYVTFLQTTPEEIERLFKALLIGVTSFFRDPEAFAALGTLLPELVAGKPKDYVFRAWVTGCATGEEAYSIAILLRETLETLGSNLAVQIFATDLDAEAIDVARAGEYPERIAADVSPRRLERFFAKGEGIYRVKKQIREMIVFAPQDVIEDPPFTKLDLVSCRNLLIYLDGVLQQRVIPIFHYALRMGGVLFLGSAESVGVVGHLFETVDKKWKIFRRKEVPTGTYLAEFPSTRRESASEGLPEAPRRASTIPPFDVAVVQPAERAILANLAPPTVLMHERGEVVHIHGRTGQCLEPAPGPQAQANIYNMARGGLGLELAIAVRDAAARPGEEVVQRGVAVRTNGDTVRVDLRVRKLVRPDSLAGLFLVAFDRVEPVVAPAPGEAPPEMPIAGSAERMAALESELQRAREIHQSTVEELETANEELKSANEELQSTNEELQSTNEALETSKEEMQSLNEELQTVNAELQGKVEALSRVNDDMKNLLNGTDIATVFLDDDLNIKRYTEQTKRVMRLIPGDVGRPIGDLVSKISYTRLVEDAREVLRTLVFKEAEVKSEDGSWFLLRILPYRTAENFIDGLVLTFVDITRVKLLQEEARRVVAALRTSRTSVFGQGADMEYAWVFGPLFGRSSGEVVGHKDQDLLGTKDVEALAALKRRVLERKAPMRERLRLTVAGESRVYELYLAPEPGQDGQATGLTGVMTELEDGQDGSS
jgi:two-component system CheB/CheR fusion protein